MSTFAFFLSIAISPYALSGHKPISQTYNSADQLPIVYNNPLFLYIGHDEDDAYGFKMQNRLFYSSTDMVNWCVYGVVASLKKIKWGTLDNGAWVTQCIAHYDTLTLTAQCKSELV